MEIGLMQLWLMGMVLSSLKNHKEMVMFRMWTWNHSMFRMALNPVRYATQQHSHLPNNNFSCHDINKHWNSHAPLHQWSRLAKSIDSTQMNHLTNEIAKPNPTIAHKAHDLINEIDQPPSTTIKFIVSSMKSTKTILWCHSNHCK